MRLTQITPFVPCTRLGPQVAFYRDVLGFSVGFEAEGYAFLRRDDIAVRLVQVFEDVDLTAASRQGAFYIDVNDLNAVYSEMAPRLNSLPDGRVRPPFTQPYGQREFHVFDEDCTLVYFGESAG